MVASVLANMLTMKDLRLNFWELSLYSQLNIIPLRMDRSSGKFSIVNSPWRPFMARLHFLLFVVQAVNANYTLLRSLLYPEYFIVRHLTFHLTLALGSCVAVLWHFTYWIQWPTESARLFTYSFPTCDAHLKLSSDNSVQRRTKLSWLTFFMPIIGATAVIFVIGISLYEPSINMLRFYGTADTAADGYFSIFLKYGVFMLHFVSSFVPPITMQLLFFENTMEKLQKILQL